MRLRLAVCAAFLIFVLEAFLCFVVAMSPLDFSDRTFERKGPLQKAGATWKRYRGASLGLNAQFLDVL